MDEALGHLLRDFAFGAGAPSTTLEAIREAASFPDDYVSFLSEANGGEGFIGEHYVILWQAEDLDELNRAYQVAAYAPGLFLIASSGGGEGFGFDTRKAPHSLVSVPFVGMAWSRAHEIAHRFGDFLLALSRTERAPSSNDERGGSLQGLEIFEIQPVILGGSPTDPANKTTLTRYQHIQAVRYWNQVLADLQRSSRASP